jgi:nuclear cap-binding protein subunit 1
MKERLVDNGESETGAMSILRFIIVESLLEIGARSFSHFLNAIERYIKVMRRISVDPQAKAEILEATGRFWKKNSQMLIITSDKLMQYQFVDPSDLVRWAFRRNSGSLDTLSWELVRNAIDKANGRVVAAQKKMMQLRKEQDEALAAQTAQVDANMEYDGNVKQGQPIFVPKTYPDSLQKTQTSSRRLLRRRLRPPML